VPIIEQEDERALDSSFTESYISSSDDENELEHVTEGNLVDEAPIETTE
jgi:hypothetical protein